MEEGKETEGKWTMKTKRQRTNVVRDREEEMDRLSELPDCVLLHIMNFMETKHAVQTCIFSKRWRNLWKRLTSLSFSREHFRTNANYYKFVSWVLSSRDGSISLLSLRLWANSSDGHNHLNRVTKYAVLHNVQQLTIVARFIPNLYFPRIFSCQSLTFLKLSNAFDLPKSLGIPALKSLHLKNVRFTASNNDCAEPFSTCSSLNTLVIEDCFLHSDAKVLCISNSNLCSLTLDNSILYGPDQIVLSTPNLRSLTVICDPIHQLSACNLSFLEQVNIDLKNQAYLNIDLKTRSAIISLLQVLADYVKTLILSSSTLEILNGFLTDSMITQIPCFVQLKTLKLKTKSSSNISDKRVSRIVACLLQKSPVAIVDVINC